ncbi:MAG TPA: hypothetical protein VIM87_04200 [Chitinophaga sp.]|uniref:hypothetical protein n=1 Tax=Chitinophaga sp. TaxID=1869181 RepID=UPI002F9307F9
MKKFNISLFILILVLATAACKTNTNSDHSNVQTVNPGDLTLSPVAHDTLSADQIEKIKRIQAAFAEVNPGSLEETITNFKRDRHPDGEIAIWLAMANAYEQFISKHAGAPLDKKKEVYKLILLRSMESETDAKANAKLKLLTNKEVAEIFSYYSLEAKPITVERK